MELAEADTTVDSDSNSTVCFLSDDSYSSGDTFVCKTSDSGDDDDNDGNNVILYKITLLPSLSSSSPLSDVLHTKVSPEL